MKQPGNQETRNVEETKKKETRRVAETKKHVVSSDKTKGILTNN